MLYALADQIFLSTPSGWRATRCARAHRQKRGISIHALRVEGDPPIFSPSFSILDFYPRPPGGGRQKCPGVLIYPGNFYPRPPGGGRPGPASPTIAEPCVSIHALRVEGDRTPLHACSQLPVFLSTPSGWRATTGSSPVTCTKLVSIHALRVEGDKLYNNVESLYGVSIHALRVEGD